MKKLFTLLLVLFISHLTFAQGGWEKIICIDDQQVDPIDYHEASNGNLLILKNISGTAVDSQVSIMLSWLDADGQTLSSHDISLGNALMRRANKLVPLSDGNFLIVGTRQVTADTTSQIMVLKISPTGTVIQELNYGDPGLNYQVSDVVATDDDLFVLGNHLFFNEDSLAFPAFAMKLNLAGDSLWLKDPSSDFQIGAQVRAGAADDGFLYLVSITASSDSTLLSKLDFDGNIIEESFLVRPIEEGSLSANDMVVHPDGGFCFIAREQYHLIIDGGFRKQSLYKFSSDLDLEWKTTIDSIPLPGGNFGLSSSLLTLDESGNFTALSTIAINSDIPEYENVSHRKISKFSPQGTFLSEHEYTIDDHTELYKFFNRLSNNGFIFGSLYGLGPIDNPQGINCGQIVRTDGNGISVSNYLSGNIFADASLDCTAQTDEIGLSNWIVEADNGAVQYFGLTDTLGNYDIELGTGNYTVTVNPYSDYWTTCDNNIAVDFTTLYDSSTLDFAAQANISCSAMWVDLSVFALRPCFESTYHVDYCNFGTVDESDAFIEIDLADGLHFVSSGFPHTISDDGVLTFDIGEVGIGECGSLSITVQVDCESVELGETLCTQAHIFPDSICNENSQWSGASIVVSGMCIENDSLRFTLSNVGDAATSAPLEYIVVEDQVIMMEDQFTLPASESINVVLPATGGTFRMESEQEPNHPGNSMPSFAIEGCGGLTPGMINLFPMDDGNSFVDVDCRTVTGSFDPNDKTGFPLGREEENIIEKNTDMEYLIRFQNTGTDTAFTVVIRDTLSEFLHPATVRPGASSHDYEFQILENGVLKFTFLNILLPDSTTNLEASNGFVEFKIKQQVDNPIGTVINNTAAIYFDFNEPVITNETTHTIGEALVSDLIDLTESDIRIESKVYPNPFVESTTIEIQNYPFRSGRLELFNIKGQLLRTKTISETVFHLERRSLISGTYPFLIYLDGKAALSGKLMVY